MITLTKILEVVSAAYVIDTELLKSKQRTRQLVIPRQVYCYFARYYAKESTTKIGKEINRDHSTVLHSIKEINSKLSVHKGEEDLNIMVNHIQDKLNKIKKYTKNDEKLIPSYVNLIEMCNN